MSLSPGTIASSEMDSRQWARWCEAQSFDSAITDAIAAHVALADPHPVYTTVAELAAAIAAAVAALPVTASGHYTPTLTNTTNITSSTAYQCQYLRVGSVVNVSGRVDIVPTVIGGASTVLGFSLPIASNLGAVEDCAGAGSSIAESLAVTGDIANDRASFQYGATAAGTIPIYFSFQYEIL